MTEEKPDERKPFLTFSFNEEGNFDRYAGIYYHHPLEKPPTPEEIMIVVGTIKQFAKNWAQFKAQDAAENPSTVPQKAPEPPRDDSGGKASDDLPRCTKKGVYLSEYTARDGRHFKARFDKDRPHKEPRYFDDGSLRCPTAIGVDEEGKTIWCSWKAEERDGEWVITE